MADESGASNVSQLVTVNQNGVIALNNLASLLQAINTSFVNGFGSVVASPANATAAGVVGQFAVNGTSFFWAYGNSLWARVQGTTVF